MGVQSIDYAAILADLEAKKAVLEGTIASVRAALAAGALGASAGEMVHGGDSASTTPVNQVPFDGDIPSGMFRDKSIPEAAKMYLAMTNRKQTTKEIAKALEEGGMHTTSDNFADTVNAGLFRASRKFGEIVRVKGQWGLATWYKMRIGPQVKPAKKGKMVKGKAKRKVKLPKASKPSANKGSPKTISDQPGAQAQIEAHYVANPGGEFSTGDLAKALGITVGAANLICAKLTHRGKMEKTAAGKYRSTKIHAMPKAV